MYKKTFALLIAVTLSSSVCAFPIGGDVNQSTDADNIINTGIGSNVYTRQDVNTIYDGADIGGDVRQTVRANNIINTGIGSNVSACQSINVIGQRDCARR